MSVNSTLAWVGSYLGSYLLAPDEEPLRSLVSYKGSFGQNAMPLRRHAAPSLGHLSAYEQIGSPGTFPCDAGPSRLWGP